METDKIPATHSECGKHTYGVGSTVLQESARDHLQCLAYSTVRPLLHPCHTLCPLIEGLCQGHFCCPTPWHQVGVCDYVPCHLHCILEITIHLGGGGGRGRREGEEGGGGGRGRREGEEGGGGGRGRREGEERARREERKRAHKLHPLFVSHAHTHLMEDVLACSPQHDGASFGLPTLHKVREVFIPNLPHLKETTPSSNV